MSTFIKDFFGHIRAAMNSDTCRVDLSLDCPNVVFDMDTAVPLGLILNELMTNSFKYAFANDSNGLIKIKLEDSGNGDYILRYTDSGIGIPEGMDFKTTTSLGLRLISRLSRQLGGNSMINHGENWNVEIRFKDTNAREEID